MNDNITMNEDAFKAMQAQIEMLTSMLGAKAVSNNADADSLISFESVSLSPLYLSTGGNGRGDIYTFTEFGEIQNIPIADAREIVRHNKDFVREGLVYIDDENFVAKENLKKYYDKIISATEMRNLLLCKRQEFGNRYSKLTETQAETVCGMLFDKIKEGKKVDEEVLFYISQYSGKDLKKEVENLQLLMKNDEE